MSLLNSVQFGLRATLGSYDTLKSRRRGLHCTEKVMQFKNSRGESRQLSSQLTLICQSFKVRESAILKSPSYVLL